MERRLPNASTRPFTMNGAPLRARMTLASRCLSQIASSAKAGPVGDADTMGVGGFAGRLVPGHFTAQVTTWPASVSRDGGASAAINEAVGQMEQQVPHPATASQPRQLVRGRRANAAQVGDGVEKGGKRVVHHRAHNQRAGWWLGGRVVRCNFVRLVLILRTE